MAIRIIRRLANLLDVALASPADGDVLTYNAGTGKFENQAPTGGGGGAPTTVDYLVGTASGGLSAEIVAGTAPGGELGGTWASPTVDAVHSGSSHASVQSAAEATAAAALAAHEADTTGVHGIANTAALETTAGAQAKADAAQAASQPLDTDLTAIAGLTPSNDDVIQRKAGAWTNRTIAQLLTDLAAPGTTFQPKDTSLDYFAGLDPAANVKTILEAADYAAVRTALSLVVGTDVQAFDAELAALAGLISAADALPYFTGSGTASLAAFTAAGRALVDDADAAAQLTTLGVSAFMKTLLDDADAATAQATLGLGSLATLNAIASAQITDGTIVAGDIANSARARDWRPLSVLSGVLAESVPRWAIANNGSILTSARLTSCAIPVLSGDVITSVSWLSATTALSAPANVWFALCDQSFNVIRQSTDELAGASWAANSVHTLTTDSVPVTAGSRSGSTTVTLTIPTLSQALSSLFAIGDSVVVSNANIAAYNGTFTLTNVTSTQLQYTAGSSASDSLSAPFPTVRMAAGKRTYTVPSDGYVYAVVMVKGTVPTLANFVGLNGATAITPILCSSGDTGLTGTCPSPIAHATGLGNVPWAAVS